MPPDHPLQVPGQPLVAANVARIHQRRLDHVVAAGVPCTLRHGAGGVADGQTGVPQGIEDPLGDELHVGAGAPAVEEEDIDVRIGVQLIPAVPPLGDHGAPSLEPRAARALLLVGHLEEALEEAVRHLPVRPHHLRARSAGAMGLQKTPPSQVEVATDALSGPGAPDLLGRKAAPGREGFVRERRVMHVAASCLRYRH